MVEAKGRGTLTITTGSDGGRIRVVFEDDGPGIRKEHLGKIFDPFFTTKDVGRGTGLGLSLSYGIVKEHGGTIQVRSRLGFGTAMSVEIPVRGNEEPAGGPPVPGPAAGGRAGSRVLVVDDEEVIVGLLEEILTAEGHRVEIARNGLEALHRLRTGSYDFVLSDLKMPGMNGEELYEKVGAERPDLLKRIVFTTGDIVSPEVQRFLKRTGNRFLTKPFSLEEVLQAVRSLGDGDGARP
ncbi:MAG: response regulator [Acidobacteria bacterium]|nr:response regulator [Acidobacteriota bacterium]